MEAAESSKGGRAITSRLSDAPSPGTYTVRWQVIGADGDLVEEDFRFAVGLALTDSGGGGGDDSASTSWTENRAPVAAVRRVRPRARDTCRGEIVVCTARREPFA